MFRVIAIAVFSLLATLVMPTDSVASQNPELVWIDIDEDGLDDLLHFVPGAEAHLLVNAGDGTFDAFEGGLEALPAPLRDAVRVDLEGWGHALALATVERTLLVGIRDGVPHVVAHLPGAESLEARDFDRDGRTDLVLDDRIYRQRSGGAFRRVDLPIGDRDVLAAVEASEGGVPFSIPAPTVDTEALVDGSVTAEKIAPGSVHREHLADELVVEAEPAAGATSPSTDPVASQGVAGDLSVTGVLHTHGSGDNTFDGRVFVGRSESVSTSEFFGIHGPVDDGYAGMYISTDGADAWPFYGYAPGGEFQAWHYFNPEEDQWRLLFSGNQRPPLVVSAGGNTGLGHVAPEARLHVFGDVDAEPDGGGAVIVTGGGIEPFDELAMDGNEIMARDGNGETSTLYLNNDGGDVVVGGEVTVNASISAVSLSAGVIAVTDVISNTNDGVWFHHPVTAQGSDAEPDGGGVFVADAGDGHTVAIDGNEIMATHEGEASTLYLNFRGGAVQVGDAATPTDLNVEGVIRTSELQITSGADLAERFEVSAPVAPGMVLSMDADRPGSLRPSREAYDPKVIGIVSGANGLGAGVILGDGFDGDQWPVALSGRAWAQCVSGDEGVELGDLLTTSARPGYTMVAADRERAAGAVVGKAMSSLDPNREGLVLVFVNPQ